MIKFSNVQLGYGKRVVLNALNFEIQKGDFFGIVGPNGAGKTTLLKAILGLLKPVKGEINFLKNGKGHKKSIGYVPQHASVDEIFPVTTLEMVLMGRYAKMGIFKRPKNRDYKIANKMLKNVGMKNLSKRNYRELSGGQKQRTLIARAMVSEPDILILDEPVEGMDVQGEIAIMELIKVLHAEYSLTAILVCHDLNIVANYVKTLSIIHKNTLKLGPVDSILNEETMSKVYGTQVKIVNIDGQKAIISKLNE
ncbi:MAG: metal ABC transporter ATP-binding protein [Candidatus Scalindua sp.]|jgi:ABC-type Mn2+/Zn2+ transport system ATPase subunit|nr:metal ABC transporter ATP-binding protein [Candidatus Scalindua sp.]MBT5304196.1 metal ABC transporter ATP-binding protein [Candidatus Scalindua sp.]MBT6050503.1 metal ABC transporter ATP-binding protein [Candidatus Scalindua sp.]MBT6228152.1 metal ABC transporter ATP-binding protein [Candidatus Scalindua sp.]MBT7210611.1 metal ABC transporter ATP-binding protein [Candidatus Scalindua sp.]